MFNYISLLDFTLFMKCLSVINYTYFVLYFTSEGNTTLTESQEVSSEDETLSSFKKPPPVSRKRPAPKKTSLDVTVVSS